MKKMIIRDVDGNIVGKMEIEEEYAGKGNSQYFSLGDEELSIEDADIKPFEIRVPITYECNLMDVLDTCSLEDHFSDQDIPYHMIDDIIGMLRKYSFSDELVFIYDPKKRSLEFKDLEYEFY